MSHIVITETMIPVCSDCGMPVPKTIAEIVIAMSRWPIICSHCKRGLNEIRYDGTKLLVPVVTN